MIVLNLNTFQRFWQGVDAERMEAAISVAASLALRSLDEGFAVGLRSNGMTAQGEVGPRIAPSATRSQATILLEHLARLNFAGGLSAAHVLLDEGRRISPGGSIVFVTPTITPEVERALSSARINARASVVYCGRFAAPVIRGLDIHLATPPEGQFRAVS